ncbi:acyl-CoA dehydrogenase family protein [Paenibacillus sp. HN-1]|uniref:acyl-CoA dehydrogenase family protein n=1 Tax=Paenibacillus TaxID=44249 RepID=UPI001CAA0A57|nr:MULTISPECIES: acyl-CoA dehydrogenase family protein [Paenibacillus]MBY9077392.1 acyl-CoA dehydrogenase family protein [Paenibacillus sp. CGMCC 1.18879]MBY9087500.1 acyl-CoA dehydrogenase family protein [Paenibacillus sinensis]
MDKILTQIQKERYTSFKSFAKAHIEPYANEWDINERLSDDIISTCADKGYLGLLIPEEYGGMGWDCVTYGLMNEAFGRESVSLSGLFNVHTMVAQTILKWGSDKQKEKWLPKMAKGEVLGALAITEPEAGSDMKGIETAYELHDDKVILNGKKRWITFGGIADIYIVFAMQNGSMSAFIVERESKGFHVRDVKNMLGFRAGHLAILEFNDCVIPRENMIGSEGMAFSYIAPYALKYGRISVACSALGLLRGCMEACSVHVLKRKTFGKFLIDHGAISKFMTDMGVDYEALKLLCYNACKLTDEDELDGSESVMVAKYFASKAAVEHSSNAVQILGALGCSENFSVARYYRDSKVFGIIEGSNEIHQIILGKSFARKTKKRLRNQ